MALAPRQSNSRRRALRLFHATSPPAPGISTLKPLPNPGTPAARECAVQCLEPVVCAPVHSRWLWWETVIKPREPGNPAAAFLKALTNAPPDVAQSQQPVPVLALVGRAPAQPAAKERATIKYPAATPAGGTNEPV